MASILAFAGSNSSTSINYRLLKYTSKVIDRDVDLLNMANHTFPMYGEDRENQLGFPEAIIELKKRITEADALIISVNEHNSGVSAYFKNILDWLSRVDRNYLENTKVLLMSTSPGKRGGLSAQEYVKQALPRVGANLVSTFTLPSFHSSFDDDKGILDADLAQEHNGAIEKFIAEI